MDKCNLSQLLEAAVEEHAFQGHASCRFGAKRRETPSDAHTTSVREKEGHMLMRGGGWERVDTQKRKSHSDRVWVALGDRLLVRVCDSGQATSTTG